MFKVLAAVAAAAILAPLFGGRRVPPFVRDDQAETLALEWALKERPKGYDGLRQGSQAPVAKWLGWVAYRRAYPGGPRHPDLGGTDWTIRMWGAALDRLRAAAAARLKG